MDVRLKVQREGDMRRTMDERDMRCGDKQVLMSVCYRNHGCRESALKEWCSR